MAESCLRTALCTRMMQVTCALKARCSLAERQCFWMTTTAALEAASLLRCCHPLQQACRSERSVSGPSTVLHYGILGTCLSYGHRSKVFWNVLGSLYIATVVQT